MADPWMKFFTNDWLGERKLKLVSRAARSLWVDMLCLMHQSGTGRLEKSGRPMTEAELAKILGDNPRTIRKLIGELVEEGVCVIVEGDFIASSRMIRDFEKAERDRSNGSKGGSPLLKNKGLGEKGVNPKDKAQNPEARSQSKKEETNVSSKKRGSRLDPDWVLPRDWGEWALGEGMAESDVRLEADRFRDHWLSQPGQRGVKLDWQATWRNWIRKSKEIRPQAKSRPSFAARTPQDDRDAFFASFDRRYGTTG